jgi:hypothetical protein
MSSTPRAVFLANDGFYDWTIAFLESFRRTNPDLPLYMIPFADDIVHLRKLAPIYGFSILDLDLHKWDELADRLFSEHGTRKSMLRKLALFDLDGPPTIYLDTDIIVRRPLDFLAAPISAGIVDFICMDHDDAWVYKDCYKLSPKLASAKRFSSGFFCFNPDKVNQDRAYRALIDSLELYSEVRAKGVYDQPIINFIVDMLPLKIAEAHELFTHVSPATWYQDSKITVAGNDVVCGDGDVLFIHWAGADKKLLQKPQEEYRFKELFERHHAAAMDRIRAFGRSVTVLRAMPKLIYADPGLRDGLGHNANHCRHIATELRRRGLEVQILAHRDIDPGLQSELGAVPHFRHFTYLAPDDDPVCGWLAGFSEAAEVTREDFARIGDIGPGDLVFLCHARPPQFMAAIAWLTALPRGERPHVVLEIGSDPGVEATVSGNHVSFTARDPRVDARPTLYRFVAKCFPQEVTDRFHVVTFEQRVSTVYSAVLGRQVGVLPVPFPACGPLRYRAGSRPLIVATLGHQRGPDKGYHLMPEIARRLLRTGHDIELLVHNSNPGDMPLPHEALCALATASGRIAIDERTVDLDTWASLLAAADLILCPYDPQRYSCDMSGVATEAVANGVPLVVPAGTTLERLIDDFGGCGTAFAAWEPGEIVDATLRAIDDYDRLAVRAYRAASRWPQAHGPARLVDALLAFAA